MTIRPQQPPPGLVVGGYELLARLGEGGMGVVHLARGRNGERVALKVLRPHVVGDEEARQRLAREVSSLSRVRSRRVAEIVDADPWGDIPFVATRYVPGLSVHDFVREEGPVGGDDLLWFADCLAEALEAVHGVGVLHRDIKPSNVLMEGRSPVLIDFGLARVADDPRLTHTGWLLGTPGYLAPEILYGDDATAASDVHSWAATVAFAATGAAPFGRGPSMAIMDRVRRGEHDLTGVDDRIRPVLEECLAPEPGSRPTLTELRGWLAQLGAGDAEPDPGEDPAADQDGTVPLAVAALAPSHEVTAPQAETAVPGDYYGALRDIDGRPWSATTPQPDAGATAVLPVQRDSAVVPGFDEWDDDDPDHVPEEWLAEPARRAGVGERLRRGLLSLAGGAVAGAAVAAAPYVTVAVLVVLVWLLRSGSLAGSAVGQRRQLRGRKWYDAPQLLLSTPWHLVAAVPGALLLVLWSLGIAAAVGLLCYAAALSLPVSLGVVGAAFALGLWWGPGSSRLRGPVSRVAHPVAARFLPWLVVLAVLLGGAAGAAWLAAGGTEWFPASGRPLEGVSVPDVPPWLRP